MMRLQVSNPGNILNPFQFLSEHTFEESDPIDIIIPGMLKAGFSVCFADFDMSRDENPLPNILNLDINGCFELRE